LALHKHSFSSFFHIVFFSLLFLLFTTWWHFIHYYQSLRFFSSHSCLWLLPFLIQLAVVCLNKNDKSQWEHRQYGIRKILMVNIRVWKFNSRFFPKYSDICTSLFVLGMCNNFLTFVIWFLGLKFKSDLGKSDCWQVLFLVSCLGIRKRLFKDFLQIKKRVFKSYGKIWYFHQSGS
jgi:hypothetical protein